jgi:peptide deformylase
MALLPILVAPDPRLKQTSTPVKQVDDEVRRLMDDMLETMYQAPGIGLAAPQVGVLKRVIVLDLAHEGEEPQPLRLANPEIVWVSDDDATYNEGCLSVPEHYADVVRPAACRVKYLDYNNKAQQIEADGLLATCLQHEIDHLDGVLFIDHLTSIKRNIILRKLLKTKMAAADAAM